MQRNDGRWRNGMARDLVNQTVNDSLVNYTGSSLGLPGSKDSYQKGSKVPEKEYIKI